MAKISINEVDITNKNIELSSNISYFDKIGKPILDEYSKELDEKVTAIRTYLDNVRKYDIDFDIPSLQKALLDLTSTIFFTNAKLEQLGVLEDVSKLQYQTTYNNAYLEIVQNNLPKQVYLFLVLHHLLNLFALNNYIRH